MKKAFTLVELLIVIIIIGMLFGAMKGMFSYKNVEAVKADTCYIHMYGKVNKFMQEALLQKYTTSGNDVKKVDYYIMQFDKDNQKLSLFYSGADGKVTGDIMLFSGYGIDKFNDCYNYTYTSRISGDNINMVINAGLQKDSIGDQPIKLELNGSNTDLSHSGNVLFLYCTTKDVKSCKEKYKISILPNTFTVKTYFCKSIDLDTGKCTNWSE